MNSGRRYFFSLPYSIIVLIPFPNVCTVASCPAFNNKIQVEINSSFESLSPSSSAAMRWEIKSSLGSHLFSSMYFSIKLTNSLVEELALISNSFVLLAWYIITMSLDQPSKSLAILSGTPSNRAITITGNKVANSFRMSTFSTFRSSRSSCESNAISVCNVFIFRVVNARSTRPRSRVCFGGSSSSIELVSTWLNMFR